MQLTLTKAVVHRDLRRGDIITHIDGRQTPRFVVKRRPLAGGPIDVEQPGRVSTLDIKIYPDTNIDHTVIVERPHKYVRRHFGDLTLVNHGDRLWKTEDERFVVEYTSQGWSECENPHPMPDGFCYGGEMHEWYAWNAWDTLVGEYAERAVDTFAEAVAGLREYLAARP